MIIWFVLLFRQKNKYLAKICKKGKNSKTIDRNNQIITRKIKKRPTNMHNMCWRNECDNYVYILQAFVIIKCSSVITLRYSIHNIYFHTIFISVNSRTTT